MAAFALFAPASSGSARRAEKPVRRQFNQLAVVILSNDLHLFVAVFVYPRKVAPSFANKQTILCLL